MREHGRQQGTILVMTRGLHTALCSITGSRVEVDMPCGCTGGAPRFEAGAIRARHTQKYGQGPTFVHVRQLHRKSHQMRACAGHPRHASAMLHALGRVQVKQWESPSSPLHPQPAFWCSEQQQWNSVNVWVLLLTEMYQAVNNFFRSTASSLCAFSYDPPFPFPVGSSLAQRSLRQGRGFPTGPVNTCRSSRGIPRKPAMPLPQH